MENTTFEIYSVENYELTKEKFETKKESSKKIEEVVKKLEKDKFYHMRLEKNQTYIIYIDLDGINMKLNLFIDLFIDFMKKRYNLNIAKEEIKYTSNNGKENSFHLTVPKFNCSTEKQKEIINNLKKEVDVQTSKKLDTSVFCNKWFRLPNQTKGYNKRDPDAVRDKHIIMNGTMEDFILNYIPATSTNIENDKYIYTKEEKEKNEKKLISEKIKKEASEIFERKEIERREMQKKMRENENEDVDLDQIKNLLDILDEKYYENHQEWLNILMILKKYEKNTGKQTKNIFIEFSKKWDKFNGESLKSIDENWEYFDNYDIKINLSSLFYYAKESDLTKYKEIVKNHHKKIHIEITEKYLCNKIKELAGNLFFYKNKIFYSYDVKNKFWYEEQPEILKNFINDELYNFMIHYIIDAIDSEEYLNNQKSELKKLCTTLVGRERVFKTFEQRFKNEIIEDVNFDEKYWLIGFNNGVYDLKTKQFRNYQYTDYMTTKTGYNYRKATDEEIKKVNDVLNKIETDKTRREFLFSILATGFIGKSYQKFIIFNGCGGNGKSLISSFMSYTLGNYFYSGDINTLCEKKTSGGNPELAGMNKKRYIKFSEPEENQKIRNGIMKSLSGDKKINGRMLFSNITETVMLGTIILECNKKIPFNTEPTDAERRRLIDFPYLSLFVEDEGMVDEKNRCYLADKSIDSDQFYNKYRFAFFDIISNYATKFLTEDKEILNVPADIQKRTDEYLEGNFILNSLLKERTEKTSNRDDYIQIGDLYDKIKASDIYLNLTKEERRKITKKYMIEFYETNKATASFYKEEHQPYIDGKQIKRRNVLLGYKFINENE